MVTIVKRPLFSDTKILGPGTGSPIDGGPGVGDKTIIIGKPAVPFLITWNPALRNSELQEQINTIDLAGPGASLSVYVGPRLDIEDRPIVSALFSVPLALPAFGAIAAGVVTSNPTASAVVDFSGLPVWFRVSDADGSPIFDGNVGSDLKISGSVSAGATVSGLSLTLTAGDVVPDQFASSVPYPYRTIDNVTTSGIDLGDGLILTYNPDPFISAASLGGTNTLRPVLLDYETDPDEFNSSAALSGTNEIKVVLVEYNVDDPDEFNSSANLAGTNEIKVVRIDYDVDDPDEFTTSASLSGTNTLG